MTTRDPSDSFVERVMFALIGFLIPALLVGVPILAVEWMFWKFTTNIVPDVPTLVPMPNICYWIAGVPAVLAGALFGALGSKPTPPTDADSAVR